MALERNTGRAAVRESGIPREEIWVTSKLWPSEYGEGKTMAGIGEIVRRHRVRYGQSVSLILNPSVWRKYAKQQLTFLILN